MKEFITTIEIVHSERSHPKYKDPELMLKDKFELVSHPKCKLQFWVKKDIYRVSIFSACKIQGSIDVPLLLLSVRLEQLQRSESASMNRKTPGDIWRLSFEKNTNTEIKRLLGQVHGGRLREAHGRIFDGLRLP